MSINFHETNIAKMPDFLHSFEWMPRSQSIITLHPWTLTTSGATWAVGNVRGRPCATYTAASGTDKANMASAVAQILPKAGIPIRIQAGFTFANAAHNWEFGVSVYGTGLYGTPATDYITLRKTENDGVPKIRISKASGAVTVIPCNLTMAVDTWYDFEILITPGPTTAGAGNIQVFYASGNSTRGQGMTRILNYSVPGGATVNAIPDTVVMAEYLHLGNTAGAGTAVQACSHYNLYM